VARAMIEPQAVADVGDTHAKSTSWPWWQALGVAAAAEAVMLAVILLPRRKTKAPSPPKAVDG
jgi:negative regulator of sigma E activity